MALRILAIEDSIESFQLIHRALGVGYQVDSAKSAREASDQIAKNKYDLILMDIQLPDSDGFKLCSILQSSPEFENTPIVFLTAKNTVSDKVLGFQLGADDFITKPFDPMELKARIDAKIRKLERDKKDADIVRIGDLEIDKSAQRAKIYNEGNPVELGLTPIEFKILLKLASKPDHVFSRDEILNSVWGENVHVYSRSVDTHVSKLRKKMLTKSDWIESVHGTGYRFGMSETAKTSVDLHGSFRSALAF